MHRWGTFAMVLLATGCFSEDGSGGGSETGEAQWSYYPCPYDPFEQNNSISRAHWPPDHADQDLHILSDDGSSPGRLLDAGLHDKDDVDYYQFDVYDDSWERNLKLEASLHQGFALADCDRPEGPAEFYAVARLCLLFPSQTSVTCEVGDARGRHTGDGFFNICCATIADDWSSERAFVVRADIDGQGDDSTTMFVEVSGWKPLAYELQVTSIADYWPDSE
jgi:hypothetical protein